MSLFSRLIPDQMVSRVQDIDYAALRARGIDALFFDLDNTLLPWNHMEAGGEIRGFLEGLRRMGFSTTIVSNNYAPRIRPMAEAMGCHFIARAGKPRPRGFLEAMKKLDKDAKACAVIGDQLFTDMWGGKRAGMYTVLVDPIAKREFVGTRVTRVLEGFALWRLKLKRGTGSKG